MTRVSDTIGTCHIFMTLPSAVDAFCWWCVDNLRRWARRRNGEKGEAMERVAVPSGTAERAELPCTRPWPVPEPRR
jgi:hypothetical protein